MMPNIKCWLGSFVIFQGILASIARTSYIFVIFQKGVQAPCSPLWIRPCSVVVSSFKSTLIVCSSVENAFPDTFYIIKNVH